MLFDRRGISETTGLHLSVLADCKLAVSGFDFGQGDLISPGVHGHSPYKVMVNQFSLQFKLFDKS